LSATIATLAEQCITGQAFGVHACQYRLAVRYVAQDQGQMFLAGNMIYKSVQLECCPRHGQRAGANVFHLFFWMRFAVFVLW